MNPGSNKSLPSCRSSLLNWTLLQLSPWMSLLPFYEWNFPNKTEQKVWTTNVFTRRRRREIEWVTTGWLHACIWVYSFMLIYGIGAVLLWNLLRTFGHQKHEWKWMNGQEWNLAEDQVTYLFRHSYASATSHRVGHWTLSSFSSRIKLFFLRIIRLSYNWFHFVNLCRCGFGMQKTGNCVGCRKKHYYEIWTERSVNERVSYVSNWESGELELFKYSWMTTTLLTGPEPTSIIIITY